MSQAQQRTPLQYRHLTPTPPPPPLRETNTQLPYIREVASLAQATRRVAPIDSEASLPHSEEDTPANHEAASFTPEADKHETEQRGSRDPKSIEGGKKTEATAARKKRHTLRHGAIPKQRQQQQKAAELIHAYQGKTPPGGPTARGGAPLAHTNEKQDASKSSRSVRSSQTPSITPTPSAPSLPAGSSRYTSPVASDITAPFSVSQNQSQRRPINHFGASTSSNSGRSLNHLGFSFSSSSQEAATRALEESTRGRKESLRHGAATAARGGKTRNLKKSRKTSRRSTTSPQVDTKRDINEEACPTKRTEGLIQNAEGNDIPHASDSPIPPPPPPPSLLPSGRDMSGPPRLAKRDGPARNAYDESPGTVKGSYLNENTRLVVSEPQFSSREKRSLGLLPDSTASRGNSGTVSRHSSNQKTSDGLPVDYQDAFEQQASLSLSLGNAESATRTRPPLSHLSGRTANETASTPQQQLLRPQGTGGGLSPGTSPMRDDRDGSSFLTGKQGSSPSSRWATGGPHPPRGSPRKPAVPSPLVDANGSPYSGGSPSTPSQPVTSSPSSAFAAALQPHHPSNGSGGMAALLQPDLHPTTPPRALRQHPRSSQPSPRNRQLALGNGAAPSPRQVASSDVFTGKRASAQDGTSGSGLTLATMRPHHPSSSPPATTFSRQLGHMKGNGTSSSGLGGDAFLTPPPASGLHMPNSLTLGSQGVSPLTGGHGALSAGAASPGLSPVPNHAGARTGAQYTGLLSSISPRTQHPLFTNSMRSRDALGLGAGHTLAPPTGSSGSHQNQSDDMLGSTRFLTSIRELTKRRLSEDAISAAAFQRGEVGGDGSRAFALGGAGGGTFNPSGSNGGRSATPSTTSPRKKGAGKGKKKGAAIAGTGATADGGGGGASSGFKARGDKGKFSLHPKSSRALDNGNGREKESGSSVADIFNVTNSGRTTAQQLQQQLLRLDAEAAAAAEGDGTGLFHGRQTYVQGGAHGAKGKSLPHTGEDADTDDDNDDDFFSDPDPGTTARTPSPPVLSLSPTLPSDMGHHGADGTPRAVASSGLSVIPSVPASRTRLTPPSYDFKVLLSSGSGTTRPIVLASGSGCVQGMRDSMEDEHFVHLSERVVRDQPVSLVGILDGHCGRRVATLGKKLLPHYFFKHPALGDNNALAMVESVIQSDRDIFYELHQPQTTAHNRNHNGKRGAAKGKKPVVGAGGRGRRNQATTSSPSSGTDIFDMTRHNEGYDDEEDEIFASLSAAGGGMVGGGSTLIAAAVHGRMLYVGCLGDARAVLLDGRTTIAMSDDHKPQNPKESKRISRCGGFVQFGRVCGVLAVSRALGDFEFKFSLDTMSGSGGGGAGNPWWSPSAGRSTASNTRSGDRSSASGSSGNGLRPTSRFGGNQQELMVSNVADVKQLSLSDDSQFLVLACDGLWDVLSNEDATQFVKDFLIYTPDINDAAAAAGQKPKPSAAVVKRALDNCSQKLAEFAVDRGSTDNVSVTLLFFHDVVDTVVGFTETGNRHVKKVNTSGGGGGGAVGHSPSSHSLERGAPPQAPSASPAPPWSLLKTSTGPEEASPGVGVSRSGNTNTATSQNSALAYSRFASGSGVGTGTLKKKKKKRAL